MTWGVAVHSARATVRARCGSPLISRYFEPNNVEIGDTDLISMSIYQ